MNILVLTQQYPSKENLYRNGFVHTRIKKYLELDDTLNFRVYVLSNNKEIMHYKYDEIDVTVGNEKELLKYLLEEKINHIFIHFLLKSMVPILLDERISKIKKTVWVHGYEALSWKRRLFNFFNRHIIFDIIYNEKQLRSLKNYVSRENNTDFVFVSNWMKKIAEEDVKIEFKNSNIIPNGIDTDFYTYSNKKGKQKNILLIRPFNSRKYATDIALEAIRLLSKEKNFSEFKITIIGEGKYLKKDIKGLENYDNVKIISKFLNKNEIKMYHEKNGIFLCPTRQDAQGVSMCEAMSSGLVPVTSNNTAIPEFVDEQEGYLCNTPEELKDAIIDLQNDKIIEKASVNSRLKIEKKCNLNNISNQELEFINERIEK
ncbi:MULTISPECIES: glycosyltransferase family 4 protein [Vagococcus]|uniref:Hypothetical and glycosyltransferase fusion protein n=1 Tax=Vagococcus fluvialis bH819 TaxID=1255619 RepID=A0A1X6WLM2_9ENTE|nr:MULTISPECIES: glycosyltransferase family 4 protein [Vagococcus]SLM85241.1 hypothetical and glycosyltransferase fusion protein [Vagococcus fluvialis bH819]HCM89459.1 hypothetical protein [Vagococcus sp.]